MMIQIYITSLPLRYVIEKCIIFTDSLSRKEREEKVRETRERMEKEKERKLHELLDAQKTGT